MHQTGSLRILIVNRHFWPDMTTYSQTLRHIAARWAADGHDVQVLTAHPSYRPEVTYNTPSHEQIDGFEVTRLRLFPFRRLSLAARLINSIPFFLGMIWHMVSYRLRGRRYDFVLAATNPPVLEVLLAHLLCLLLDSRLIYHMQDIHPEVEVSAGVFSPTSGIASILRSLDSFVVRGAAACVALSSDMAKKILERPDWKRGMPDIRIINNFIFDLSPEVALPPELARDAERFRVIFAGNVGLFQGLEQLIASAHLLADKPEIEFLVVGNGIAVESLKKQADALTGHTVRFIPVQSMGIAHALVEDADLAVVVLKPGVIRLAYPSKAVTYAAAGTKILAIVEKDSELARTVTETGLGLVVEQDRPEELADSIRTAYCNKEEIRAGRTQRKKIGTKLFNRDTTLDKWSDLISSLSDGS